MLMFFNRSNHSNGRVLPFVNPSDYKGPDLTSRVEEILEEIVPEEPVVKYPEPPKVLVPSEAGQADIRAKELVAERIKVEAAANDKVTELENVTDQVLQEGSRLNEALVLLDQLEEELDEVYHKANQRVEEARSRLDKAVESRAELADALQQRLAASKERAAKRSLNF